MAILHKDFVHNLFTICSQSVHSLFTTSFSTYDIIYLEIRNKLNLKGERLWSNCIKNLSQLHAEFFKKGVYKSKNHDIISLEIEHIKSQKIKKVSEKHDKSKKG